MKKLALLLTAAIMLISALGASAQEELISLELMNWAAPGRCNLMVRGLQGRVSAIAEADGYIEVLHNNMGAGASVGELIVNGDDAVGFDALLTSGDDLTFRFSHNLGLDTTEDFRVWALCTESMYLLAVQGSDLEVTAGWIESSLVDQRLSSEGIKILFDEISSAKLAKVLEQYVHPYVLYDYGDWLVVQMVVKDELINLSGQLAHLMRADYIQR